MAKRGETLAVLLERVEAPHPSIQRFAVDSVFEAVRNPKGQSGFSTSAGRDAVVACLSSRHVAVVDQSVKCLCKAVSENALPVAEGLSLLMGPLVEADSGALAAIVFGIGEIVRRHGTPAQTSEALISVLESRDDAQPWLLDEVSLHLLSTEAEASFASLLPFFIDALLPPSPQPSRLRFKRSLRAQLAKLCILRGFSPDLVRRTVSLLVLLLSFEPLSSTKEQEAAITAAHDVTDLLASLEPSLDVPQAYISRMFRQVLSSCLTLAHEVQKLGSPCTTLILLAHRILRSEIGRSDTDLELLRDRKALLSNAVQQLTMLLLFSQSEAEQLSILRVLLDLLGSPPQQLPADQHQEHQHRQQQPIHSSQSRARRVGIAGDMQPADWRCALLPCLQLLSSPPSATRGPVLKALASITSGHHLGGADAHPLDWGSTTSRSNSVQPEGLSMEELTSHGWSLLASSLSRFLPQAGGKVAPLHLTWACEPVVHPGLPSLMSGQPEHEETSRFAKWALETRLISDQQPDDAVTAFGEPGGDSVLEHEPNNGIAGTGSSDRSFPMACPRMESSWLAGVRAHLIEERRLAIAAAGRETALGRGQDTRSVLALAALLFAITWTHVDEGEKAASLRALGALVASEPVWGFSLVPAFLWLLTHRQEQSVSISTTGRLPPVAESPAGGHRERERAESSQHVPVQGKMGASSGRFSACILEQFPSLAYHWLVAGPVLQILQPMAQNYKKHPLLAAICTRSISRVWLNCDRAYPALEALLRGTKFAPSSGMPNAYMLASALSLRDVCRHDPGRGTDLVIQIQTCIESPEPDLCALGLECLALLCRDDLIDFYTAWKVVRRTLRQVPQTPVVALRWCQLLAFGSEDAEESPEAAAEVLSLLWECSGASAQGPPDWTPARAAGFAALSRFNIEKVVELELWPAEAPPGASCTEALLAESAERVWPPCERLLRSIIQYEHKNRPRGILASSTPQSKAPELPIQKLLKAIVLRMCPEFSPPLDTKAIEAGPTAARAEADLAPAAVLYGSFLATGYLRSLLLGISKPARGHEAKQALKIWSSRIEAVRVEAEKALAPAQGNVLLCAHLQDTFEHLGAAVLAMRCEAASGMQSVASAAEGLILETWALCATGTPTEQANAYLLLAGICKALPPSVRSLRNSTARRMVASVQQASSSSLWAAAAALGSVCARLHPTEEALKGDAVEALTKIVVADRNQAPSSTPGAALYWALLAIARIAASSQLAPSGKTAGALPGFSETSLIHSALATLLQVAELHAPAILPDLAAIAKHAHLPATPFNPPSKASSTGDENQSTCATSGVLAGLGTLAPALATMGSDGPSLVTSLARSSLSWISLAANGLTRRGASLEGAGTGGGSGAGVGVGAAVAFPSFAAAAYQHGALDGTVLLEWMAHLCKLAEDGSAIAGVAWEKDGGMVLGHILICICTTLHHAVALSIPVHTSLVSTILGVASAPLSSSDNPSSLRSCATAALASMLGAGLILPPPSATSHALVLDPFQSSSASAAPVDEAADGDSASVNRPLLMAPAAQEVARTAVQRLAECCWDQTRRDPDSRVRGQAVWALGFCSARLEELMRKQEGLVDLDDDVDEEEQRVGQGSAEQGGRTKGGLAPLDSNRKQAWRRYPLAAFLESSAVSRLTAWLHHTSQKLPEVGNPAALPLVPRIASVLGLLASAPRVPALDWPALLGLLFRHCVSLEGPADKEASRNLQGSVMRLGGACAEFGVAHSVVTFLEDLCTPSRLGTMPAGLFHRLVACHLADVIPLLPDVISTSTLDTLSAPAFFQSRERLHREWRGGLVSAQTSVWLLLAALLRKHRHPHSVHPGYTQVNLKNLIAFIQRLLPMLPLPKTCLSAGGGESAAQGRVVGNAGPLASHGQGVFSLSEGLLGHGSILGTDGRMLVPKSQTQSSAGGGFDAEVGMAPWCVFPLDYCPEWRAAVLCMSCLDPRDAGALLKVDPEAKALQAWGAAARHCAMRIQLLRFCATPPPFAAACRVFLHLAPLPDGMDWLLPGLASAVAAFQDVSAQRSFVLDTLDALQQSRARPQAFALFALVIARLSPARLVLGTSGDAATDALPHALPALLARPNWAPIETSVTSKLFAIFKLEMESDKLSTGRRCPPEENPISVLVRTLLAMRGALPQGSVRELMKLVFGMVQE